ncbi:unnamed protein product [Gordionus sp. m RMFG-2023]
MSLFLTLLLILNLQKILSQTYNIGEKTKSNKSISEYNDLDFEKLSDEWENDEDKIPLNEQPMYKQPPIPINMNNLNMSDPQSVLKQSKKGKTVMMFVTVSGNPTKNEADKITSIWHSSLYNAHYDVSKYMIENDRAIFVFNNGEQAWDGKEFLIKQDRCDSVTLENENYYGKGSKKYATQLDQNFKEKKEL